MMKSLTLAVMMMTAMTASAVTKPTTKPVQHPTTIVSGRGHTTIIMTPPPPPVKHDMRPCNCHECKNLRKALDKHMRKFHTGKHNKKTCHTCMEYSHLLNTVHQKPQPHHHR